MSKLQPGRDMDKKVHTEVMGKQVTMGMAERTIWNPETEQFEPHFTDIPHYSTNIADAWKIVDKWIADNKQATFDLSCEYWGCDVRHFARFGSHPRKYGTTPPEAICRARLKVVATDV